MLEKVEYGICVVARNLHIGFNANGRIFKRFEESLDIDKEETRLFKIVCFAALASFALSLKMKSENHFMCIFINPEFPQVT